MAYLYVYVSDGLSADGEIYPPLRREIIDGTENEKLKKQRTQVWALLKTAVENSLGLEFETIEFSLAENGKWSADKFFFSLSHTEGLVAVAVSSAPTGIDVEDKLRFSGEGKEKLLKRIAADGEEDKDVCALWTQKESIFKCGRDGIFKPKEIKAENYPVTTFTAGRYMLSVCGENVESVNYCFLKDGKIINCKVKDGNIAPV